MIQIHTEKWIQELIGMFDIGISDALTSLLNKIPYTVDPIQMLENGRS